MKNRLFKLLLLFSLLLSPLSVNASAEEDVIEKGSKKEIENNVDSEKMSKLNSSPEMNDYKSKKEKFLESIKRENPEEIKERRRELFDGILNAMNKRLDAFVGKVENSNRLEDNRKKIIILEANEYASRLKLYSNLGELEDEEIKENAKNIKLKWNEMKEKIKWWNIEFALAGMDKFFSKNEVISQRIIERSNEMSARGLEIKELENYYGNYDNFIGLAEQEFEKAQSLYEENEAESEIADEVIDILKESREQLVNARESLRLVVQEIKSS